MENLDSDDFFEFLISFVRDEIGEYKIEITKNSILEDDLGITGDDAVDLIIKYGKQFNVDVSEFDFKKYFHPEPGIFNTFSSVTVLKMEDLLHGIQSRKLI